LTSVCLVSEGTYPHVTGGVTTWTAGLVSSLPDVDWSVASLADGPPPSVTPTFPPQVGRVVDLVVPPSSAPLLSTEIIAALASEVPDADVYHATTVGVASAVAAAAAAARAASFILTEHGIASLELALAGGPLETGRRSPDSLVDRRQWVRELQAEARRAYAAADVVIAVSRTGARFQQLLGATGVLLIPHPPAFAPVIRHRSDPQDLLVGMVARVVPLKDVVTFIRAAAQLSGEIPSLRFVVVGPVDADLRYVAHCRRVLLEEGLDGRLSLVGEDDVSRWWSRFSVLVSTSRSEGRPFALLEAMQHGVPVVATDVGDCAEMLCGGGAPHAGVIVRPGDVRAVAAAVGTLLAGPRRAAACGASGAARVAAMGTPAQHAARYEAIYERCTRRRCSR